MYFDQLIVALSMAMNIFQCLALIYLTQKAVTKK